METRILRVWIGMRLKAKDSIMMANLVTNTPGHFKTEGALSPALSRASEVKLSSD